MALVKCKECGGQVSTEAKACPSCGAKPPKQTSSLTKLLAIIIVPSVLYGVYQSNDKAQRAREAPPKSPAEVARDLQRGVAANAVKALRDAMHDPKSFELNEALFMPDGAGCYTYRAKNGFGAMRRGEAVLTPAGQLLASQEGDKFARVWNKHCTGKPAEKLTAYVKMAVL